MHAPILVSQKFIHVGINKIVNTFINKTKPYIAE